jgi:hypothetical protein
MGLLAVTNGRLAFAGTGGEVAVPLGAILELDVYDDGIAVSSLGQERQLFLVAVPGRVAMYLNWAICRYV